jgi:hypothetical protein
MRFPAVLIVLVALVLAGPSAAPSATTFSHLAPGQTANLAEKVPVQFVFVGYEPAQVNQRTFFAGLPSKVDPVIRSRLWYGVKEPLGVHYTFDYKVAYADAAYEDAFFTALANMATPAPLTLFQGQYNAQAGNVVDVTDNYFIDGPTVEKWLIDHPISGMDTRRNTVFFVNWWGRTDFRFHTYTKFGEPDPDTGYDFGVNRQTRKIIAWGGTTPDDEETGLGARGIRRIWFYDLSAGPESWTDNWNVTDADVDGDGRADYRMPPIWEYLTPGGYRAASALASDLGKVARYVAINLLFTPSPLYPPAIGASGFLGFADDNWVDGTQSFTFNFVSPGVVTLGYGLTTTQIHEYGHHFGMSHPHDGYDSTTGVDYGPEGEFYFAWSGDEVNSMMSYIDLNWDYSQFDRDNANRFQAAAYITNANAIAALILASPNASAAQADLKKADTAIGAAKRALAAHDYAAAFTSARDAYLVTRQGAAKAGVQVAASANGWFVLDPIRPAKKLSKRAYAYQDRYGPETHRSRP